MNLHCQHIAKKGLLLIAIACLGGRAAAQDIQFSQYYNLVQYQNPAFVGTDHAWRAIAHSRLQWPGLEAKYVTSVAAIDYNWARYNSGVGAMFITDFQGGNTIQNYKAILQYAYQIKISDNARLRAGLNLGFSNRVLRNQDLYYPGQFTGTGFDNSQNAPQYSKNYLDIASGLLFYTDKFWLGISGGHINRPNQSFVGNIERIPVKVDVLTGYRIVLRTIPTMRYLDKEDQITWALFPSVLYKYQGKSDQLDMGIYTIYDKLKVGVWYRGIPIKNYTPYLINNEAFVVLAGVRFSNLSFTYSYDFTVSKLQKYSQGAHELNLTYLFPKNHTVSAKYKRLPCPEFYGID